MKIVWCQFIPISYAPFLKLTDVAVALVGVGIICNSETNPGVVTLDKDYLNISKFLNRILGMPVDLQNRLFQYFTDTLAAIVLQAKKSGRYDLGILDLGSGQDEVKRKKVISFMTRHPTGVASIDLHTFEVERGMSWEQAKEKWSLLVGPQEGFYVTVDVRIFGFKLKFFMVKLILPYFFPHRTNPAENR